MKGVIQRRMFVFVSIILFIGSIPPVDAELSANQTVLNAICIDDSTCILTNSITGIDEIKNSETSASPLSPEIIQFEFKMSPPQSSHALIPVTINEVVVDLTIEEDPGQYIRPDLNIILAIGPSTNQWLIEGQSETPISSANEYRLEDREMDLSSGRILSPNDVIQLTLAFEIDRPVTWKLGLSGSTYLDLPIIWSLNPDDVDVDEPSSLSEPKSIEVGDQINGALIEQDIDCFTFSVGERASELRIDLVWSPVPSEIATSEIIPILDTLDGQIQPYPSIRTTQEDDLIESVIVWDLEDEARLRLCFYGESERFGVYTWIAQEILPGTGAMEVSDFELDTRWPTGTGWIGQTTETEDPNGVGGSYVILIGIGTIISMLILKMSIINPISRKWGIPCAMILILIGSVVTPLTATISTLPNNSEKSLDEWIDNRLDLVAKSVIEDNVHMASGFFGTEAGENFAIRLHIKGVHPTGDGRWQIQTDELNDLDLDRLIFDEMKQHSLDSDQQIMYILRAGRLLSLDLLLLEASLISNKKPVGSILHIDWDMTDSIGVGSVSERVWTTRPSSVDWSEWNDFTTGLLPELITISYCDCGLDAIDLSIRTSVGHTSSITPTANGIFGAPSYPLFSGILVGLGFGILLVIGLLTNSERKTAQKIILNMKVE